MKLHYWERIKWIYHPFSNKRIYTLECKDCHTIFSKIGYEQPTDSALLQFKIHPDCNEQMVQNIMNS